MRFVKPALLALFFEASFILLTSQWKETSTNSNLPEPVNPSTIHLTQVDSGATQQSISLYTPRVPRREDSLNDSNSVTNGSCMLASRYRTWGDPSGLEGAKAANQTRWHCLPTYLGIGFPKCGSSTLWRYLQQHPRVKVYKGGRIKEAHFWHQPRAQVRTLLASYTGHFPPLTAHELAAGKTAVGEHTPGYVWRVPYQCKRHPRHQGCWGKTARVGVDYTVSTVLKHLGPNTKYLVSLRDPVKRAYSHYWHFSSGYECNATAGAPPRRAPECFHASVVAQIDAWRACEARVLQETKAQAFPRRSETQADASIRPSTPLSTKDPEAVVEVDQCAWGDRSSSMAWSMAPRAVALGLYAPFLVQWFTTVNNYRHSHDEHSSRANGSSSRFCVVALEHFAPKSAQPSASAASSSPPSPSPLHEKALEERALGVSSQSSEKKSAISVVGSSLSYEMTYIEECLGVPPLGHLYEVDDATVNRRGTVAPPMLPATDALLRAFYAPHNERLSQFGIMAHIMRDSARPPPSWLAQVSSPGP